MKTVKEMAADTALLALSTSSTNPKAFPRFRDAVLWLDKLHASLIHRSAEASNGQGPSVCFSGCNKDGTPMTGHEHVTFVPLRFEEDMGRLNRVLVYVPMGMDELAVEGLRRLEKLAGGKKKPDILISLVKLGKRKELVHEVQQFKSARVWQSITPFVPPRYMKPRGASSLAGQVRAELISRGFPERVRIEVQLESGYAPAEEMWSVWHPETESHRSSNETAEGDLGSSKRTFARMWTKFRRERVSRAKRPPLNAGFGLRLSFDVEVAGPIAIGYASHFGLGQFIPEKNA